MAKQERYQSNYTTQFRSPNPTYSPDQIGSPVQAQQAEFDRQNQGYDRAQQQVQANQDAALNTLKGQIKGNEQRAKNLQALGQFSETLAKQITTYGEKRWQEDELEGQMLYSRYGIPQEMEATYQLQKAEMEGAEEASFEISGELAQQGQFAAAREVQNLTGAKAWGYMKAAIQDAGLGYEAYRASRLNDEVVNINGRPVSYKSASNLAERQAVVAELDRQYLSTYQSVNPALLNEYLFPKMRQYEAASAVEWQVEQGKILEEEQEASFGNELVGALDEVGGVDRVLNKYKPLFGSDAKTREKASDLIKTLWDNKILNEQQLLKFANQTFQARDGKTYTIGSKWPKDFGWIPNAIQERQLEDLQDESARETQRRKKWQRSVLGLNIPDGATTEDMEDLIRERGRAEGIPTSMIEETLKDVVTREELEEKDAKERADALAKQGLPIPMRLAMQLDPAIRNQYRTVSPDAVDHEWATNRISAQVLRSLDLQGVAEPYSKSVKALDKKELAEADYYRRYNEYRKQGLAHDAAMRAALQLDSKELGTSVLNNIALKEQNPYEVDPQTQAQQTLRQAERNRNIVATYRRDPKALTTGVLPGTEEDFKELEANIQSSVETGLPIKIPQIYHDIAAQSTHMTAYDVAAYQYKAAGKGDLPNVFSPAEQEVLEMPPQLQRWLVGPKSTPATQRRAFVELNSGAMPNASSGLSDPDDPNSPRIGDQVGGGTPVNASGVGGGNFIVDNVPAQYREAIIAGANQYGIPPAILAGLIEQESGWRADAYNTGSGATGIAQIVAKWHPTIQPGADPAADIIYAAKYLRELMDNYGYDLKTAIYAYNAGPGTIERYGIGASSENANYYPGVMRNAKKYGYVEESPYNQPENLTPSLR